MATKKNGNGGDKLPLEARVIQCITGFTAPKTTQDNVDKAAAEFATANLLRMYAEKRYSTAKQSIVDEHAKIIDKVKSIATSSMTKTTETLQGGEWTITIAANKPALRVDVGDLRTELIRRGVNVDLVDSCINNVSEKSSPALLVSAAITV